MTQIYFLILDCNNKYGAYNFYHFFTKKKEIGYVRFQLKIVTICFSEKKDLTARIIIDAIN